VTRLVSAYGFRRPEAFLARRAQRLDDLAQRLERVIGEGSGVRRTRVREAAMRLAVQHPRGRAREARTTVSGLRGRLDRAGGAALEARRSRVGGLDRALRALDPTAVLERGYCLAFDPRTGSVVRAGKDLDVGGALLVQFHEDRAHTEVTAIEPGRTWPAGTEGGEDR